MIKDEQEEPSEKKRTLVQHSPDRRGSQSPAGTEKKPSPRKSLERQSQSPKRKNSQERRSKTPEKRRRRSRSHDRRDSRSPERRRKRDYRRSPDRDSRGNHYIICPLESLQFIKQVVIMFN